MDLFSKAAESTPSSEVPLAEKLRPKEISEILGQVKALDKTGFVMKRLESGQLPSLLIWGPPGSGKTTFARVLSSMVTGEFIVSNAISTGTKEIREWGLQGRERRLMYSKKTVLFIDEIHRLNKSQQDVLLPFVECGDLIFIGATTENPSYEVNSALLSRCHLIRFERLGEEALTAILKKSCHHYGKNPSDVFTSDSIKILIENSNGDARRLLGLVESVMSTQTSDVSPLTPADLVRLFDPTPLSFDKKGSAHYDTISAFIKSVRGSDPHAAVYYLARMILGGEDPKFIARRLIILASEDIGNADPRALPLAVAAAQAVEFVGLPECAINLSQTVTYLACCPKSNASYSALIRAKEVVQKTGDLEVPTYLHSSHYGIPPEERNYQYPHDHQVPYSQQTYLPSELKEMELYFPKDIGFEKQLSQYLKWLKGL